MSSKENSLLQLQGIEDILEVILSHISDEKESKKASLICKTFYEQICKLRGKKLQYLVLSDEVSYRNTTVIESCNDLFYVLRVSVIKFLIPS